MKQSLRIVALCLFVTACAGIPTADVDAEGETNKAIVRTYIQQIFNTGDWSVWPEIFGDTLSFGGQTMTMQDMRTMTDAFRSILPDMQMTIESQFADGDMVATRVTVSGTHAGDYMGIKASGQQVSFNGLAFDHIEDGKIVESWHEMNIWGTLLMADDD